MIGTLVLAEISPALPLHEAGKYVAGAYVVLFAIVLIYVAIMALRLSRMERDLGELLALSQRATDGPASADSPPSLDSQARDRVEHESTPA